MKQLALLFLPLLFQACSDDASVNIFDKKITKQKIECMRLVVFPPEKMVETTLRKLYSFDSTCRIKLEVSTKSGIRCNSNQNTQKKALSNFPTSYIKLQLMTPNLAYSYYKDLVDRLDEDDVRDAFSRVDADLVLR